MLCTIVLYNNYLYYIYYFLPWMILWKMSELTQEEVRKHSIYAQKQALSLLLLNHFCHLTFTLSCELILIINCSLNICFKLNWYNCKWHKVSFWSRIQRTDWFIFTCDISTQVVLLQMNTFCENEIHRERKINITWKYCTMINKKN